MTDDAELERLAEWLEERAKDEAVEARYFSEMGQRDAAKLFAESRRNFTAAAKAIRADLSRRLAEAEDRVKALEDDLICACDAADAMIANVTAEMGKVLIEGTDELDTVPIMKACGVVLPVSMWRALYDATDRAALAPSQAGGKLP